MPLYLNGTDGVYGVNGTTAKPAVRGTDETGNGIVYGTDTVQIATGGTTAVTVDSSQNVGIGTASPSNLLHVSQASTDFQIRVTGTSSANAGSLRAYNNGGEAVGFGVTGSTNSGYGANLCFLGSITNVPLIFLTNNGERARIDSSGNLLVGTTTAAPGANNNEAGIGLQSGNYISVSRTSASGLYVNRRTTDGSLVEFNQDNITEGNISVSGTTVSYNGGHLARWSQLLTGERDASILKGTVMSNLDEMCVWEKDGQLLPNEQLNRMKISDVEGDINVAGVFVNWDNDDTDNPYDMNIAMTGDMIIRIADDVVVQKGDLLMSAGDGTAKPQGDDIVRSKTIAKVTSNHVTCTYDDGSYCVPCVLMAC